MAAGQFLIAYGAAFILPLAILEGPFVSMLTGSLSANGFVSWHLALILLVGGDLVGDALYYAAGRFSGFERILNKRLIPDMALIETLRSHPAKSLIIGKWTHTFGCLILIGGGIARVPFGRFLAINLAATIPKSAVLFGIGYFAAGWLAAPRRHVTAGLIVLGFAGIALFALLRRSARAMP